MTLINKLQRTCSLCLQEQPITSFYEKGDGRVGQCKTCLRKRALDVHYGRPVQLVPYKAPVYHKVKRGVSAEDRRAFREAHLLRSYGLTQADYDLLLLEQDGKCAICFKESALVVDHDHRTGKVRGLLCGNCNTGLGLLSDSSAILSAAVRYLEK